VLCKFACAASFQAGPLEAGFLMIRATLHDPAGPGALAPGGSGRSRTYARSGPPRFKRRRGGHQRRCCHHRGKARYRPAGLGLHPGGARPSVPL
jgi:hypothetical protein